MNALKPEQSVKLAQVTGNYLSLSKWCILHAYRGSIAHGMYVPSDDPNSIDDIDTMAVCVPPDTYYFGLRQFGSRGTREIKQDELDIVVYELRKFVGLLAKGNPNVLTMLWLPERHIILARDSGQMLIENRDLFAHKKVYKPFAGYAASQLHKMEKSGVYQGYMGERRKKLVDRFGYDTKNAAHLIRLLRMGIEFLSTGSMRVDRTNIDADELLAIKRGEWELEQVKEAGEDLFARLRQAKDSSPLPDGPDMDAINNLCTNVVGYHLLT